MLGFRLTQTGMVQYPTMTHTTLQPHADIRPSRLAREGWIPLGLAGASLYPLYAARQVAAHGYLNDDALISLTYAKNLAAGHGFVFNHPPATLGTTTPLFTLVTAGLGALFPQISLTTWAVFFSAFCAIGTIWTFYLFRSAWRLEAWQAGIIGLFIAALGWTPFLGMEAYLFAFLLVLSCSLFCAQRPFAAGMATGLLFLTRGEGILLLAPLTGATLISGLRRQSSRGQRDLFYLLGGFVLPVALWAFYAQLTFGAVLPNSLAAKQAQEQSTLWRPFWIRLAQEWAPNWGRPLALFGIPALSLWWPLILLAIAAGVRYNPRPLIFLAWAALYVAGYVALGVSGYAWYELPIRFVLQIFVALGVIIVVEQIMRRVRSRTPAVILAALLIGVILWRLAAPQMRFTAGYAGDVRGPSYSALAAWLREHSAPTDSVAYIEIGYLGYLTDNRIIDLAGLVLPEVVPHVAEGDFAWAVRHYRPTYYVHLPDFDWALSAITSDPRFAAEYAPVVTLPGPYAGDLTVYRRKDAAPDIGSSPP